MKTLPKFRCAREYDFRTRAQHQFPDGRMDSPPESTDPADEMGKQWQKPSHFAQFPTESSLERAKIASFLVKNAQKAALPLTL
jgi:hypothetical protein